ncbi:hypothetical protein KC19_9G044300 [Ceratodon purpureus]|uniref:Secreted peptide n=1 Tax=Ceratodon purpureus TaxID=3225 RepID=A0A8T0GRI0_CERPU|nr:hypothetical protein KC19_9G044300 [Ceratodon purpureus]
MVFVLFSLWTFLLRIPVCAYGGGIWSSVLSYCLATVFCMSTIMIAYRCKLSVPGRNSIHRNRIVFSLSFCNL